MDPKEHVFRELQLDFLASRLKRYFDDQSEIRTVIERYLNSGHHGFQHTQAVYARIIQVIKNCPNVWRLAQKDLSEKDCFRLLFQAAVFHDFSRFFKGVSYQNHERKSAELVEDIFRDESFEFQRALKQIIIRHDYFCPLVDGEPLPVELMAPLPEIFRLADKTSLLPEKEIERYYLTGREFGAVFLDPGLTDGVRFNFQDNLKRRDQITWFLMLFALEPENFCYQEISFCYFQWSRGKLGAVAKIRKLAQQEQDINGCPVNFIELARIISNFNVYRQNCRQAMTKVKPVYLY